MADIIELARALGRQLQQEEAYIRYSLAKQAADEDEELQKLINEFGSVRNEISLETSKPEEERDSAKVISLNKDMRKLYAKIMTNERMMNYNDAKDDFDIIFKRITAIIQQCSQGEDPDTADYTPSCTGSCGTCGGCG